MFDDVADDSFQTVRLADMQSDTVFRSMVPAGQVAMASFREPSKPVPAPQTRNYDQGFADGQRLLQDQFETERASYIALIADSQALQNEPSAELAVLISAAVERLVCCIVGNAEIDSAWLNQQAAYAAAMVAECDAARTLWVHPDDIALIDDAAIGLKLMADPDAQRGSIRIECSQGWIEHSRAYGFDQMRLQLGFTENAA